MKTICKFFVLALALLSTVALTAQNAADRILGNYRVESLTGADTAIIKITRTSKGTYQGRIVWLNNSKNADGTTRTDSLNKNPKLRSRTYDQVYLFWNLQYDDGEWVKGSLYDAFSGNTVSVKLKMCKNNRDIEARYYKGVPAMGITRTWTKMK